MNNIFFFLKCVLGTFYVFKSARAMEIGANGSTERETIETYIHLEVLAETKGRKNIKER